MNPMLRVIGPRTKAVLVDKVHQAQFPEGGTIFETAGRAERAASDAIGPDKQWRVDPIALNGENFYVVKIWPKGRPPICAERRWAVFNKPQSRRKPHATQSEN